MALYYFTPNPSNNSFLYIGDGTGTGASNWYSDNLGTSPYYIFPQPTDDVIILGTPSFPSLTGNNLNNFNFNSIYCYNSQIYNTLLDLSALTINVATSAFFYGNSIVSCNLNAPSGVYFYDNSGYIPLLGYSVTFPLLYQTGTAGNNDYYYNTKITFKPQNISINSPCYFYNNSFNCGLINNSAYFYNQSVNSYINAIFNSNTYNSSGDSTDNITASSFNYTLYNNVSNIIINDQSANYTNGSNIIFNNDQYLNYDFTKPSNSGYIPPIAINIGANNFSGNAGNNITINGDTNTLNSNINISISNNSALLNTSTILSSIQYNIVNNQTLNLLGTENLNLNGSTNNIIDSNFNQITSFNLTQSSILITPVTGSAIFNDYSYNNSYSPNLTATFNGYSYNKGTVYRSYFNSINNNIFSIGTTLENVYYNNNQTKNNTLTLSGNQSLSNIVSGAYYDNNNGQLHFLNLKDNSSLSSPLNPNVSNRGIGQFLNINLSGNSYINTNIPYSNGYYVGTLFINKDITVNFYNSSYNNGIISNPTINSYTQFNDYSYNNGTVDVMYINSSASNIFSLGTVNSSIKFFQANNKNLNFTGNQYAAITVGKNVNFYDSNNNIINAINLYNNASLGFNLLPKSITILNLYGNATLRSPLTANTNFYNNSLNFTGLSGNINFYNNSINYGSLSGNVTFNDLSYTGFGGTYQNATINNINTKKGVNGTFLMF